MYMAYKLIVVEAFKRVIIINRQAFLCIQVFRDGGREACIALEVCTYVTHGMLLSFYSWCHAFQVV